MQAKDPRVKELDILVQKITAFNHKNCVAHHVIHRANFLFRWDFNNLFPCTVEQHNKIHSVKDYENSILDMKYIQFREENKNKSLKDYLLKKGITEDEFLLNKKRELQRIMPNIYESFINQREQQGFGFITEPFSYACQQQKKERKVQLRELKKPKTKKHKDILKLRSDKSKEAYQKVKAYKKKLLEEQQKKELDIGMADSLMNIFGFKRNYIKNNVATYEKNINNK